MPNSYSRRNRSNNSPLALLSKPPLAPAPQVEGRLVTPGGVGQHSPAQGGHHSIAKPAGGHRRSRREATLTPEERRLFSRVCELDGVRIYIPRLRHSPSLPHLMGHLREWSK